MAESKSKKISRPAEKIISYLNCPCDVFVGLGDDDEMLEAYKQALQEGRTQGYVPLLIVPDETLAEHITLDFEAGEGQSINPAQVAGRRADILKAAEAVEAADVLGDLRRRMSAGRKPEDIEPGPVEGDNILSYFSAYWDYAANRTHEVVLAKVPAAHPWELAAWLPMGGFNDCPLPEHQVAVMKRWHEKYGAVPVVAASDTWEFMVPEPLADEGEALELAYEHYAFCPERVEQYGRGEYRAGNLADSLMKSTVWYFCWD